MNIAAFHMLPSGGGARLASQNIGILRGRFSWFLHDVEGSVALPVPRNVSTRRHPFPSGRRLSGVSRLFAPWLLVKRLLAFGELCSGIASEMNREGQAALVHNSMVIAAPPVLDHLSVPSVYFCYEYPRHLYEKDCVRRTGSRFGDLLLFHLEREEKRRDRASVAAACRVATFSPYMRDRLRAIYGIESTMVYPGVDSSYFTPGGAAAGGDHLLSVGALWPFKGHDTAVHTVSLLPREIRPPLVIAADREFPGYGDKLERLAAEKGVVITIHRAVTDDVLLGLYRRALAVLCFQRNEPYGLVPLEAMACGRPVVARNSGGLADNIKNRETGLMFHDSVHEARDLVHEVIADTTLSKRLGEAGRAFVTAKRTLESCAERLADLIQSEVGTAI
ncbi:MAG: glycosyltransferase family 4 protein [Candidatus Fermentibacteraceae bacterium]